MTNNGSLNQIGTAYLEDDVYMYTNITPAYEDLPSSSIHRIGGFTELIMGQDHM